MNEEYTIKELANELSVSKQTILDKIKKLGLQSSLSRKGNRFVLSSSQVNLIKSTFSNNQHQQTQSNFAKQNDILLYDIVKTLQKELDEKNLQLAEKDKQIASLTETIRTQAQSINADNHTRLAETVNTKLLEEPKKGFFSRLFGKEN